MSLRVLEQTLHDIAMAIGNSLDMDAMLREALPVFLRGLGCMAGDVLRLREAAPEGPERGPGEGGELVAILSLPALPRPGGVCQAARAGLPDRLVAADLEAWSRTPPAPRPVGEAWSHLLALPEFGLLHLLRHGEPLPDTATRSLAPLLAKLARACLSCQRAEEARAATDRLLEEIRERVRMEAKYRDIFENAVEGIYQTSLEGRFLDLNPALANMLGYDSPAQAMALCQDFDTQLYVRAEDRHHILDLLRRDGIVTSHEVEMRTRDDGRVWVSLSGRLAQDSRHGEIFEGICENATQRKATLHALETARDAAERLSQMKTNFLNLVSHELRTPMTSILGFATLVKRRVERKILPDVQCYRVAKDLRDVLANVEIIASESKRLGAIINNTLELARLESGMFVWRMEPFQVEDLLVQSMKAIEVLFVDKGLELVVEAAPDLPEITGDFDRLMQVLLNLFANALKFTQAGGVHCHASMDGDWLLVRVRDTGLGIPDADKEKVFDKFRQLGDTLVDKPTGAGLGLSICKEIIASHGGDIWVEDAAGGGCVFVFTLPRTPPLTMLPQDAPGARGT